jgi:DNA-binding NarL/FixJ family response regulator
VLLDMALPGCLGLPAALHAEPAVKFVAFGVSEVGDEVLACAEAGIAGYVGKDAYTEDLAATIEGTLRGEVLCPPRIVATLFQRLAALVKLQAPQPSAAGLSLRQLEILRLIDQGHSNKEIAKRMRISVGTVKNHVHGILDKLQVHRRAEAAAVMRSAVQAHREPSAWHHETG